MSAVCVGDDHGELEMHAMTLCSGEVKLTFLKQVNEISLVSLNLKYLKEFKMNLFLFFLFCALLKG